MVRTQSLARSGRAAVALRLTDGDTNSIFDLPLLIKEKRGVAEFSCAGCSCLPIRARQAPGKPVRSHVTPDGARRMALGRQARCAYRESVPVRGSTRKEGRGSQKAPNPLKCFRLKGGVSGA